MFVRHLVAWMDRIARFVLLSFYLGFLIVGIAISFGQASRQQQGEGIKNVIVGVLENLGGGLKSVFSSAGGEE
jgi:hypothetical protein